MDEASSCIEWPCNPPAELCTGCGHASTCNAIIPAAYELEIFVLRAGVLHPGFALMDLISPCVTFN